MVLAVWLGGMSGCERRPVEGRGEAAAGEPGAGLDEASWTPEGGRMPWRVVVADVPDGRDVNRAFEARLEGLDIHGGVQQQMRVGTWQMMLADALEANPGMATEELEAHLVALGVPVEQARQLIRVHPVMPRDAVGEETSRLALSSARAYGALARVIEDAFARSGEVGPADADARHRILAEGLRCAWLGACTAGMLKGFADRAEEMLGALGIGELALEVARERRHAADATRWVTDYFAARLVGLHGIDPTIAMELAIGFGGVADGHLATPEQMFRARESLGSSP